jgi:hypothetical protein
MTHQKFALGIARKGVFFGFALFVLAAILFFLQQYYKPHASIVKLKTDFTVSAADILSEFQQDEATAAPKYNDKVVEISGTLVAKKKTDDGSALLILQDTMEGISCQLDPEWAKENASVLDGLAEGSPVHVKGVCKGYLMELKISPAMVVTP